MGRAWLALIGAMVLVTACATANPSRPPASAAPAESDQVADAACRPIDLRAPSGDPVDLTGAWRANDLGQFDLHQRGSCLYWLGRSQYPGEERGQSWTNVFTGTIGSDFTITGRWGDVPFNPDIPTEYLGSGVMTMAIDFGESVEGEYPILRTVSATGGFGGSRWVPASSLSPAATLDGTLGGNYDYLLQTGCIWVEANGQRYEMFGSGRWEIKADQSIRIEDDRGQVVARADDPIQVVGLVSAALGTGCVESAILVEELDPTP